MCELYRYVKCDPCDLWHDSLKCSIGRISMCGVIYSNVWHHAFMTHAYVWQDSSMSRWHGWASVSMVWHDRFSYMRHDSFRAWHNWFLCVTGRIHTCDVMNLYVRHDSCIFIMTWIIHIGGMTHSHVQRNVQGRRHTRYKTRSSVWRDAIGEDCFYYCSERNNVVVLFGTFKVQSFILT